MRFISVPQPWHHLTNWKVQLAPGLVAASESRDALHFLHYVTGLRMTSDVYATMDLALIDLQLGRLQSWKAGALATEETLMSGLIIRPLSSDSPITLHSSSKILN